MWCGNGGKSFLQMAPEQLCFRESRGFFRESPPTETFTDHFSLEEVFEHPGGFTLRGILFQSQTKTPNQDWKFSIEIQPLDETECLFRVQVNPGGGKVRLRMNLSGNPEESIFGTGTQFSHVDLKGKNVPILCQEPGIGRGIQPLSGLLNLAYGAAGSDVNSNAPSAHFLSSDLWAWMSDNTEPLFLDFQDPFSTRITCEGAELSGRFYVGESPRVLTERFTQEIGRMRPLPAWVHEGAILGVQGGTQVLAARRKSMEEAKVAISALWLQDWVGQRTTSVGKQLWWNWELDEEHYPDWSKLAHASSQDAGPKLLSYVNPFVVNTRGLKEVGRNLFEEAHKQGFLVQTVSSQPYWIANTSFDAALVDLSNPEAREWLKEILKDALAATGTSGWMADFGEALPLDAVLHRGETDAHDYHNHYPVEWAKLNREVLEETNRLGNAFFFTRAGHTRSPAQSTCFWLGDQLTSWRGEDGIKSALYGLLSSGFSGFTLNHSDIGGYTTTQVPGLPPWLPGIVFRRSQELLCRWIEMNAFTLVFRTHEGNRPSANHQVWDSPETTRFFAHFSHIYRVLAPYRKAMEEEAFAYGYPVVRHLWFEFPHVRAAKDIHHQFLLGDCLLVAPVLDKGVRHLDVFLPPGQWEDLWTGTVVTSGREGTHKQVPAPLGRPCVWCKTGSVFQSCFEAVRDLGPGEDL